MRILKATKMAEYYRVIFSAELKGSNINPSGSLLAEEINIYDGDLDYAAWTEHFKLILKDKDIKLISYKVTSDDSGGGYDVEYDEDPDGKSAYITYDIDFDNTFEIVLDIPINYTELNSDLNSEDLMEDIVVYLIEDDKLLAELTPYKNGSYEDEDKLYFDPNSVNILKQDLH